MSEAAKVRLFPAPPEAEPQFRHADGEFHTIVSRLCEANGDHSPALRRGPNDRPLPSRQAVLEMLEIIRSILFPGYFGATGSGENVQYHVGVMLDRALGILQQQLLNCLNFFGRGGPMERAECEELATEVTRAFLRRLCGIKDLLASDVQAAYSGDPAAGSPDETIYCYPGIMAVTNYRIAHELYLLGVPLIARIITEHAHGMTGIDIHPGARIGRSFFIDHGTGVVIGETAVIGERVRLYQGVTLGARNFQKDKDGRLVKGIPRHPIVEDDVVIYAGATLLGRITIGRGSVIGGNVWLTNGVPPGSRITQARAEESAFENGEGI
jgi:serine O-acetyltransferase